jgi:type I restriction-modification system DNA methylase subunit
MSEELGSKYVKNGKIIGQKLAEFEYFQIGATTFNQLQKANLMPNTFSQAYSNHKPDRIIVDRRQKTPAIIAIIEDKPSGRFNSDAETLKAIRQCNNYCHEVGAIIGAATDGVETYWINPRQSVPDYDYVDKVAGKTRSFSFIVDENDKQVMLPFEVSEKIDLSEEDIMASLTKELYVLIKKLLSSVSTTNSKIVPLDAIDPLELATRVWQDIWVATGKSPEKCLYNVVELFIFKFLSDLGVLQENFDRLWERVESGQDPKEVLRYYVKNSREEILRDFKKGADGTTIINGTIFVNEKDEPNLSQAFLFVNTIRKFKDFENKKGKFSNKNIDKKFKTELYEKFLKQTSGLKALGQFFTPRKVVRAIVEMARHDIQNLDNGDILCDPFCGVGGFVLEPINLVRQDDFMPKAGKIMSPVQFLGFDKGFEKDEERTIILAKANMLIYLADIISKDKLPTSQLAEVFNNTFKLFQSNLGTLGECGYEDKINLILTNPPYVTSGSRTIKDEIEADADKKQFYSVNATGVEGLALEWIVKSLKPDNKSRAFVIVPDGILNRLNDKKLRKFLLRECYLEAIISLPPKTFFTTPKKTYILVITRKSSPEKEQNFPVFTYLASNIGETLDVNRFEIEENDLVEAVQLFNRFHAEKNSESVYELNNESKRCKIQPLSEFDPVKHWSIDRWWTKQERIDLGIEEEEQVKTADEFFELITDSANRLEEIARLRSEIVKKNSKSEEWKYKSVSLNDGQFFELGIGARLLKKNLRKNNENEEANIPVYSANVYKPFGYVKDSNIEIFNKPFVLWGIDGNFDFSYMPAGEKFASTDHCGTIEVLDSTIDPGYLLYQLELKKIEYGFDRGLRSNLVNVRRIEIEFPITRTGEFNIEAQKELVRKRSAVTKAQFDVDSLKKEILDVNVSFDDDFYGTEVSLSDIVDFTKNTNNSSFTKAFINKNPGPIPVYSASEDPDSVNYGYVQDDLPSIKYFDNCMTWNIDGSVGKVIVREGRFSLSEKVIPLIIYPQFESYLSKEFLKFSIEKNAKLQEFGFSNKAGKYRLKRVKVKIPINDAGKFDLKKQVEIANKYNAIEQVKADATQDLEDLGKFTVNVK